MSLIFYECQIMKKLELKKDVAFVNRKEELRYLSSYLRERPESILFVYGPKSSGKTTLLYKLVEQMGTEKRYDIKVINLREILMGNYKDFVNTFFNVVDNDARKTKSSFGISAGIFKITRETEKKLLKIEADPFKVMKQELIKVNKSGRQPVIIIDELQALQNIYMNGQKELVIGLFNFFVAMTKESHLAHIIISSSDGYFIETVYEDSRLRKTSKFFKIDYLKKEDVQEWLGNIEKYSKIKDLVLSRVQIEEIWDLLGGSCWEIQSLLSDIMIYDYETAIAKNKKESESEVINAVAFNTDKKNVLKLFGNKRQMREEEISRLLNFEEEKIKKLLGELVAQNILFFDPVEAVFKPQSKSTEYGMRALKKIEKKLEKKERR